MEIVGGGTVVAKKKHRLTLEDYLGFINDRTLPLNVHQLRQIIGMHGFKRMTFQKSKLIEMVTTMDLMDLHRSTLQDGGVSGDACFNLEEVINDLKDLDWQECHVTSLVTQGAVVSASSAASSEGTVSVKPKRRIGRKRKPIEVEIDDSVISTGTTVAAGSTTSIGRLRSVECNSPESLKFKSPEAITRVAALN
ncbi:hypothetical protein CDL12_09843 [Handroanthus impetiginosus]|uniref:DUF7787 domain-containing protein n=1 Tax=Handroanthus impetiginosus TaxID=429701 RepID=A0A2G9HIZ1_9LAMI|nr:hypothetical protein CDL12_09843 [Handroanthus impetiginosus]